MTTESAPRPSPAPIPSPEALRAIVRPFERPDDARAWWVVATSLPPYVLVWYLAYRALAVSWWLTLALTVVGGGFVVRTFIVQHDCGHGSFFRSARLRAAVGRTCSLVTLIPYAWFRRYHGSHHATSSKLHDRGVDIQTLTVREYLALDRRGRIRYRLLRNPIVLFGAAPLLYFVVGMRLSAFVRPRSLRERRSIALTNLALAALVAAVVTAVGLRAFVLVQLPISLVASTTGMWLFYVQHQFEHTYWAQGDDWDFGRAALEGSSYYALPPVLAWFTGYIGFHHVHHLSPRVPCYRLVECHAGSEILRRVPRMTLGDGLRTMRLKLWDEDAGQLTGWSRGSGASAR
jgi:omega-6 fatty acid desaturase (delta-12 desaturase)